MGQTAALVLLVSLALAGSASADIGFEWQREPGAERCPDGPELLASLEARAGRSLFVPRAAAARVLSGRVSATHPGHHVLITLRAADGGLLGARELADEADDCAVLRDATLLTVLLMLDAPAAPRGDRTPRPSAVARSTHFAIDARAGLVLSVGLLPSPAPHAMAGIRFARDRFALELAGVGFGSADVRSRDQLAGVLDLRPGYALLDACAGLSAGRRHQLAACLGAQVGAIRAEASGFMSEDRTYRTLLLAPVARVPLVLKLVGRLQLLAAAGLGAPVRRTRYMAVDGAGQLRELARTPRAFGSFELALSVDL